MGAPKKRLMWLDIGDPNTPVLVWQDGDVLDRARVKDKDRMSLIDIIDIKAGQVSAPLRRSGRVQHADKYLSFTADDRTFDVETATVEGRDWLFKKFADLFQAYATAKIEGRQGDSATLRVSGPTWSQLLEKPITPLRPTRPKVGLKPTMPHIHAGVRTDPPVSVPSAKLHRPAATAAADPVLELPV